MRRLVIFAVALANVALIWSAVGGFRIEKPLDARKFIHDSGHCFVYPVNLFTLSDSMASAASELLLFEDDKLLGPGHAPHEAIRHAGEGRFSHWYENIYLSSSDNSDPRTNARKYKVLYPIKPSSSIVGISLLITTLFLPFASSSPERRKRIYKRYYLPVLMITTSTALLIIPTEMFLRTEYSKQHVFGALHELPAKLRPTLNSKGYRDIDHDMNKTPGSVRILILGDSLTYGSGVADNDIYPRVLQRLAGPNIEVISLAQQGWGTADELDALRHDGLIYKPDIVIVGVVTNDPSSAITGPTGQSLPWKVFQRISRNMMLFKLLDLRLDLLAERSGWKYSYSEWESDLYDPQKKYRGRWEEAVSDLSQELRSRSIAAYAVVLVGPAQTNEVDAWKFRILDEVFSKAGFRTLNLREFYIERFQGVDPMTLFALPDDGHPGREVHEFYADEVWKVLKPETMRILEKVHSSSSN